MSAPFFIKGMGWALPDEELGNGFLREEVGLSRGEDWVRSRLGIRSRRTVLSREYIKATKNADPRQAIVHARARGQTPVTLGARAARQALAEAGAPPERVGMVVCNCDLPFDPVPPAAYYIARELGVGAGPHMDLNAACSSFARHMEFLGGLREESWPDLVLCVQTSCYTTRTDYSAGCADGYIWGDGAAAQVCSLRGPGRLRVEPVLFSSDPRGAGDVTVDGVGHFWQDGAKVREFSIRRTVEAFEAVAAAKGLYAEEAWTVTHQANRVMMDSIIGHLGLPPERLIQNVETQGNIAAAGMPSAVAQRLGSLSKGDKIVYAVLGAGLAWGGGLLEVQ